MANAPQANLRKIGLEGFALVDKFFGPPRRYNPQGCWVVRVTSEEMYEPAVINSNDAAARYGGVMVMNYPKGTKPQNRRFRPIKA